MRILHTSDWHLGQTLFSYDRSSEQQSMLREVGRYAGLYQPDALVVSGDIFHTAIPSAATQKMFVDAVLDIHHASPETTIVITGGNHDSASRLEVDRELWQELGIHVLGRLHFTAPQEVDYDRHIINIEGRGTIIAIPHFYTHGTPDDFFRTLGTEVETRKVAGLPVVLMAHLTAFGGSPAEASDVIGDIEATPLDSLGCFYDYLALGHIHRPQNLSPKARYCGSPIAVSFDEDYQHSVSIVDISTGQPPLIETLPIHTQCPLLTIPEEPASFDEVLSLFQRSEALAHNGVLVPTEEPSDAVPYIRLNVLSDAGLPTDAAERAAEAVAQAGGRFCTFRLTSHLSPLTSHPSPHQFTPDELKQATPTDIARRYLEMQGIEDDGLTEMIDTVIQTINEEDRQ